MARPAQAHGAPGLRTDTRRPDERGRVRRGLRLAKGHRRIRAGRRRVGGLLRGGRARRHAHETGDARRAPATRRRLRLAHDLIEMTRARARRAVVRTVSDLSAGADGLGVPAAGRGRGDRAVRRRRHRHRLHGGDETIAAAGQGVDEPRRLRVVAQRLPDLVDAEVQAAVEIHEGVLPPQLLADLLARHHVAGAAGEEEQNLERLGREMDGQALAPELSRSRVHFVDPEAESRRALGIGRHG
jgi:hypothetical protein